MANDDPFKEGSFFDNFDAGIAALGVDQVPIAWDLARINYRDTKERDQFLTMLGRLGGNLE